jgi:hypothetical protein
MGELSAQNWFHYMALAAKHTPDNGDRGVINISVHCSAKSQYHSLDFYAWEGSISFAF